jgi:hypothetical protein
VFQSWIMEDKTVELSLVKLSGNDLGGSWACVWSDVVTSVPDRFR